MKRKTIFASLMGIDDEKIVNRGVKDTLEKIHAGRATADVGRRPAERRALLRPRACAECRAAFGTLLPGRRISA